jgi:hypothetical protein
VGTVMRIDPHTICGATEVQKSSLTLISATRAIASYISLVSFVVALYNSHCSNVHSVLSIEKHKLGTDEAEQFGGVFKLIGFVIAAFCSLVVGKWVVMFE